jgi:murein L,D-transpeptidase YcbB/YkuD
MIRFARTRLAAARAALGLAAWLACTAAWALGPAEPVVEALRERIELASETGQLEIAGAEIVSSGILPLLYGESGYEPLWGTPGRVETLMALVAASRDDGLLPVDYHLTALARLLPLARSQPTPGHLAELDLLASDSFMLLLYHMYFGKVDPRSLEPTWNFESRQIDGRQAVDYVREAIRSGRLQEAVDAARPDHWMYQHGRDALRTHRQLLADGGWPTVPGGETLKPGMRDPRVVALRRRLAVTGDLAGQPLDDDSFDDALAAAVRAFQERHRLNPDAEVGPATLAELNVPAEARVRQIQVNLERARHVLHEIGDEDLVIVDIAGYELRYVRDRKVAWTSRVVVGRPYRQTPIFKSAIDHVIVNPTWTVPPTILAEDILPAVRKDRGYLARKGLDVVDRNGRVVDPASIDWSRYTGRNFPYILRQGPGDDNALGRVKIMFPNPYLVYLHDTPSRALFERDERAFSSGCIRVERPFELVERLLDDPAWDAAALQGAVASGRTQTIRLAKPVKLLLIYWTVDETDDGRIVFKRDVYDRDARLWEALNARFEFGSRPGL